MHNNSLIILLKAFTPKEISDFKDFLISPYFNRKNSVIKLYEIIQKSYPDFNNESVSKKNIHTVLFPGKAYTDSNLRVLVHNLYELAKKFITYRNFENNKVEFDYRQIEEMLNKHQFNSIDKLINKLSSSLKSEDMIAEEFSFNKFRIENEHIFYLSISHAELFDKFLDKANFEKAFKLLSSYYYLKSMRLYINILNIQIIYKKEFSTDNFKKMISSIDKNILDENPVAEIFYCIIKLFEDKEGEKYYYRIKELLMHLVNKIHFEDLSEIYINLTNYCNRRIAIGSEKFQKEKFELYKEEIEHKLYLLKGSMSPVYYKNLVILALSLKENKWVKEFILNYKKELPSDSRENIYTYCMALYEFEMKNFEESLKFLSLIKFNEIYMKYDSKILQLMIYYEMNDVEPLLASLEAFRHFLSNNKLLPDKKKESYQNFYRYINKVLSLDSEKSKTEPERILKSLTADVTVVNKSWIVNKIKKIISG